MLGTSFNFAGIAASKLEYSNVLNGMWRGANGKWNNLIWGGNKSTGSRSIATNKAGNFRNVGRGIFYVSTTISLYQGGSEIITGNPSGALKPGLDIVMGGVATFGGPSGMIIGGIYYTLDALGAIKGCPMMPAPIIDTTISVSDNTRVAPTLIVPKNINYIRPTPQLFFIPSR